MSYSALVSFMPILLNKIGTKITNSTELYGTILAQVFLGIPGTLISSYLVTTVLKKKWTTSISFLLASLCVFIFLISTKYWMVLLSTSFIYFFNFMGYASIMAIIPESYPVNVRSIGTGWVNAWCKFGGVISPVAVGILFDLEGGITLSVLLISLCFAAVGVISAFFTEPNAKEIEEEPLWGNNFG